MLWEMLCFIAKKDMILFSSLKSGKCMGREIDVDENASGSGICGNCSKG